MSEAFDYAIIYAAKSVQKMDNHWVCGDEIFFNILHDLFLVLHVLIVLSLISVFILEHKPCTSGRYWYGDFRIDKYSMKLLWITSHFWFISSF